MVTVNMDAIAHSGPADIGADQSEGSRSALRGAPRKAERFLVIGRGVMRSMIARKWF